jgi:hypothetical protein
MEGRYWQDSSHGEYYLDLAARDFFGSMIGRKPSDDEPVRLIKEDTWESWEINLPIRLIDRSTIQHFQGTESFFVAGRRPRHLDGPSWKESNCWSFLLVSTKDKKAEKFCLPYGEWSASGSTLFMDTKAGPFFYVHKSRPGLYSYNNGKPIKVFEGYLLKTRGSPSGCKIAFSSIPSVKDIILRQNFLITHYVLDVCTSLKGNSK